MLERSFSLLYYLKKAKNQKNENRYIYLRITANGKRTEISIKRQCMLSQWDSELGRTTGINEEAKELNSYLDLISLKVYRAKTKLLENNKPLTAHNIKDVLTGHDEKKHFVVESFISHNKQIKFLVGKEIAPATLTRYRTACDHVQNFIKWKYKKDDLELKSLDYEFVSQFLFWLKTERNCANNTAIKYLGNFRKIVLECQHKGLLIKDPFLGFKTKRDEVEPVVLTRNELTRISNKQFETNRLNLVRDIFLFSCYTGFSI